MCSCFWLFITGDPNVAGYPTKTDSFIWLDGIVSPESCRQED